MEISKRKKILKDALITSFVEDYEAYKNTVDLINEDLKKSNIDFIYTYDHFCIEFLNQTMKNTEEIDIFSFNEYDDFYYNFYIFNLYNIKSMLSNKFEDSDNIFDNIYNNDKKYID